MRAVMFRVQIIAVLGLMLAASAAEAGRGGAQSMNGGSAAGRGGVPAEVVSVHDGDTFAATARVWPDIEIRVNVRLAGVDTAELRGKCAKETRAGRAARDFVRKLLPPGSIVSLTHIARDKYAGRVDAAVRLADGRDLAELLLARGLAKRYDGGRKPDWC